jgi:hypothetical protein
VRGKSFLPRLEAFAEFGIGGGQIGLRLAAVVFAKFHGVGIAGEPDASAGKQRICLK